MHNNIEKERAYIFSIKDAVDIAIDKFGKNIISDKYDSITDYYLQKNIRIRNENGLFFLQRKTGNKCDLQRLEESSLLSGNASNILKNESKLQIDKKRFDLFSNDDYIITLDILKNPFKIAILEIESRKENTPPTLQEILKTDHKFIECPLSIWDYTFRKIGICGGPSAGKTEVSKYISNRLNADFKINSFCTTEYATSFIQKYKRNPTIHDQFIIWNSQQKREEDASKKHNVVISDSPTFLSYIYSLYSCKEKPIEDKSNFFLLTKLYKRCLEDLVGYQQIFLLNTIEYTENGIRFHDKKESDNIKDYIKKFLQDHGVNFIVSDFSQQEDILKTILYMN